MNRTFSFARFWAVLTKEFVQMRRDRLTFAMMVGVPIMQLILFGFAINSDPKSLPTAVLAADNSIYARTLVRAIENSGYFRVVRNLSNPSTRYPHGRKKRRCRTNPFGPQLKSARWGGA